MDPSDYEDDKIPSKQYVYDMLISNENENERLTGSDLQ